MPQDKIEIRVEIGDKAAVIEFKGDLTLAVEPQMAEAYAKAKEQGPRPILFNFAKNAYIDSGGIATLLQILVNVRKGRQKAAIAGVSPHIRKMFGMLGVTRIAEIYDTAELALASVDHWK